MALLQNDNHDNHGGCNYGCSHSCDNIDNEVNCRDMLMIVKMITFCDDDCV